MNHECNEYASLSRRDLLRASLLTGATTMVFGGTIVQTSYAATPAVPSVLVVLSLRGAADGLSLVVPHGDPGYYTARPGIAVPRDQLVAGDSFFGLHPALAPLLPLWNSGRMASIHATGMAQPNRSHFAAMEIVETAAPGSTTRTGWINRLVGRDTTSNPLQAVQYAAVPTAAFAGPQPVITVKDVDSMSLAGHDAWDPDDGRPRSLRTIWGGVDSPLAASARLALSAVDGFAPVRAATTRVSYPDDDLGKALQAAARTIRGNVGAEVIALDAGGWDMHANVGTLAGGRMVESARSLAAGIAAFFDDLADQATSVTLVTISEFGRRVRENGDYGLDHGHGNVMLAFGAGVRGGYYGAWPSIVDAEDSDLGVTTDYRNVLAEILVTRLGASPSTVFPGLTYAPVGFMRTS